MILTAASTGQLIVYVTDDPIDDSVVASAKDMGSDRDQTVFIDGAPARHCSELERLIARAAEASLEHTDNRNILITNLLDAFYETSIPTREAARILGRVKCLLESMVERGAQVVVFCQRRSEDLGTRSHFVASLCASADRVHFRRST